MSTTEQDRAQAFEEQMLGWLEEARLGVPVLTLLEPQDIRAGRCISCGDPIPTGWRCDPCCEAIATVLEEFSK